MKNFKNKEDALFEKACSKGSLEDVREILQRSKDRPIDYININDGLRVASSNNHLEIVKYLFTSEEVPVKPDIHYDNDAALFGACYRGHVEMAKFLLSSKELQEHADINSRNSNAFVYACENNHLNLVKLLLSETLVPKVNIHAQDDYAFITAIQHKNLDIVQSLVFDFNFPKTQNIEQFLIKNPNEEVQRMFTIRELSERLGEQLKAEEVKSKKLKI